MIPQLFNDCHWARSASNTSDARYDVFGKQAGFMFMSSFSSFNLCLSECLCWVNSAIDNLILELFLFTVHHQGVILVADTNLCKES